MWEFVLGVWFGGYLLSITWLLKEFYYENLWSSIVLAAVWFIVVPLMWFNIVKEAWEGN